MKNETITLKEFYERLVQLEAKFDHSVLTDDDSRKQFRRYVYWLATLTVTDIIFSIWMLWEHWNGK